MVDPLVWVYSIDMLDFTREEIEELTYKLATSTLQALIYRAQE